MWSAIFIFCAAFFKAIADTLAHHFDTSIFKHLPKQFWNPAESYKYVKFIPLTRYRPDAWHLSNSAMIVCFLAAIVMYDNNPIRVNHFWFFIITGVAFNVVFEILYSSIFRRK